MEYTEYMETLKEQIQNKRARSLVAEEIRGHIEEQAKEYQAEGMSKEDAEREAVRQMGDPVETGCALNRIHRPAFPWKLFVLAVFLTGASMLISLTIDAKINEDGVQAAQVGSLFMEELHRCFDLVERRQMLHPSYNHFTTERICAPLCQQVPYCTLS